MDYSLSKEERICSVKAIENLVAGGKYAACSPVRCCFLPRNDASPLNRMMVSVPKKLFKRAVKRNLLKRRIRESYRLQKHILTAEGVDMMFVYTSKEVSDFQEIFSAIQKILVTVDERIAKLESARHAIQQSKEVSEDGNTQENNTGNPA